MFIRAILITSITFLATVASTPKTIAQDAAIEANKNTQPVDRPKTMDAIKESVKDLTDEQKENLESLKTKAIAQEKALFESAGITWKMSKQRSETYEKLKAKGIKGKELSAQASKEADYTDEQAAAQSKAGKVWNDYRYAIVNVLTAEQRKQLPNWLTSAHAARVKAEKEKAAAKKK
ncbi:LTXXQ motif protein [Rubripirellula tenax]|uniref:LTXXQ motif protein n=1 Tax=Rubripirellula tenax TaxID=2528015 RepID=A0A5C6F004_9BACT|nr:Spy/CpxP family protein refolding chaperone [Rubripirellula tenax]TWU54708.1 LTXXQ motif protein [Rubripirellula tenax]